MLKILADDYYNYYKDYYSYVASYYGITYEEYLTMVGTTDAELKAGSEEDAKNELEFIMVGSEIAKVENLSISKEEYESEVSSIVEEFSYESSEKFMEQYANHPENYLYESFIFDNVTDLLKEKNQMVVVDPTEASTTQAPTTEEATAE